MLLELDAIASMDVGRQELALAVAFTVHGEWSRGMISVCMVVQGIRILYFSALVKV